MKITRSEKMTLAALAILIVGIVAVWFYRKKRELFEDPTKVTYYYMNGCPHCENFMSEWGKFEAAAANAGVTTKKVEASEDPDTVQKLGIKGFPTVMIEKAGEAIEYAGARTSAALMQTVKG